MSACAVQDNSIAAPNSCRPNSNLDKPVFTRPIKKNNTAKMNPWLSIDIAETVHTIQGIKMFGFAGSSENIWESGTGV